MNLHLAVQQLAVEHRLDARARARLERIAGLGVEPPALQRWLALGVAVLAAALLGLGLILWIAANWQSLGRFGRFAVLQGTLVVFGLAALRRPGQRTALALVLLLATGALFAYFGQTYQTGADPWQLFALWAALTLPLGLGLRSDVLWVPWVLVAMTAVSLWTQAHTGHVWRVEPADLVVHLIGWAAALAVVVGASALARARTGAGTWAGIWAQRTAATLATMMITFTALGGLFFRDIAAQYVFGLLPLAVLAAVFAQRRHFDVFVLSAVALAIDTLLVAGLARLMFDSRSLGDPIGRLFLIGLVAAGLLAASVSAVLKLARRHASVGAAA
ncbi:MAG: DUF2157 domain-containing protein [Burkholderiaceae bacterium]